METTGLPRTIYILAYPDHANLILIQAPKTSQSPLKTLKALKAGKASKNPKP